MKSYLAILLLVVGFNLNAQQKEIRTQVEYHDNLRQVKEKYEYYFDFWSEQNVKHGRYSWWSKKGKLQIACTYQEGDLHGAYIEYYPDGSPKQEIQYIHGRKNGKAVIYSKQGLKLAELNFSDDLLSGFCRYFYKDGTLKQEITYQNGVKDGPAFYYDKSGNLKSQKTYKAGKQVSIENVNPPKEQATTSDS